MKIGFIGAGEMAIAIVSRLNTTSYDIIISDSPLPRSREIAEQLEVGAALSHQEPIDQSGLVILDIKPQMFGSILAELHFHQSILSMTAGVALERLGKLADPNLPLIHIMPNFNAQILKSTIMICTNDNISTGFLVTAKEITDDLGSTFDIPGKDFDTFATLADSSPACIYLFIEALAKVSVEYGIPEEESLDIVTQTVLTSAGDLLQGSNDPHDLINKTLSPDGTTIAGSLDLERTGLTASIISNIDVTIDKAKTL